MTTTLRLFSSALAVALLLTVGSVRAEDLTFPLTIKDHMFDPAEIAIPADTKVKLLVKNADPTPEEFDSAKLHREKVIPGGQEGTISIGPLKPGRYEFMGEYHSKTARGAIVAK